MLLVPVETAEIDTVTAAEVRVFERELEIPCGFFESLLDVDDWTFVIKLHALLEATMNHLLAEALNCPAAVELFSHLELSNKRVGKLEFGRTLGCVDDDERRFISYLSELRNKLVHDVRNATFGLTSYVNSLDINQLRAMANALYARAVRQKGASHLTYAMELLKEEPKWCIWDRAMYTIVLAYSHKKLARAEHDMSRALHELRELDEKASIARKTTEGPEPTD
jgi:hypothetical protein